MIPSAPSRPAPPLLRLEALSPWQLFFGLRGRIGRREYWRSGLLLLLLSLWAGALLRIAGLSMERAEGLVNLLLAWPAIAISVKRWHDRDRSGWWVLVYLIPVVGWLWGIIDNGFLRGNAGPNRFGAPLQDPPRLT